MVFFHCICMDLNGEIPGFSPGLIPGNATIGGDLTMTGRIILSQGTAAQPSLTFKDNQNYGFFWDDEGKNGKTISIATSGELNSGFSDLGFDAYKGINNYLPGYLWTVATSIPLNPEGFGFLDNWASYLNFNQDIVTWNPVTGIGTVMRSGHFKINIQIVAGTDTELTSGNVFLSTALYKNGIQETPYYPCTIVPASGLTATPNGTTMWMSHVTMSEADTFQLDAVYENFDLLTIQSISFQLEFICPFLG